MHIPLHLLKFVKIHFTTIFSRKIDYLRVGTLVFCTCHILSEYGGNYRNCFILYILIPVGFPVISACTCFLYICQLALWVWFLWVVGLVFGKCSFVRLVLREPLLGKPLGPFRLCVWPLRT